MSAEVKMDGVVSRHQVCFSTASLPRRRGTCRYVCLAEYQVSVKTSLAVIKFALGGTLLQPPAAPRNMTRLYDSLRWWLRGVKSPRVLHQQRRENYVGGLGAMRELGVWQIYHVVLDIIINFDEIYERPSRANIYIKKLIDPNSPSDKEAWI